MPPKIRAPAQPLNTPVDGLARWRPKHGRRTDSLDNACGRLKNVSHRGELIPAAPNVTGHDFSADAPNEKWVTDITKFPLPTGKVYLPAIIDCFDGIVVSRDLFYGTELTNFKALYGM